jgi:hypothetical protein
MPLVRLVYFSLARPPEGRGVEHLMPGILWQGRRRNLDDGVTAVLVNVGPYFVQMMEGQRDVLTALFDRIYRDPRHSNVEMVDFSSIRTRELGDWSLAYHQVDPEDEVTARRFARGGAIDPAQFGADMARHFILAMARQGERAAALRAGFATPATA